MKKVKTKVDELVDLKDLLKKMKKSEEDFSVTKDGCKAITSYIEDLENKIEQLEKDLANAKKQPESVTPTSNSMGYYPVCPKCGRDLGQVVGRRFCDCGATLSWISDKN